MAKIDRSERRDWDVEKSFIQFVFPAIVGYFVVSLGAVALLKVPPFEQMYSVVLVGLLIGMGFIGLAARAQKRQMAESYVGYNVQDEGKPLFLFGKRKYSRYRVDEGTSSGPTPYRDKLEDIKKKQREMRCTVCADEIGRNGGYFVETRYLYRVFGFPVRETIIEMDAYCTDHKPKDFR